MQRNDVGTAQAVHKIDDRGDTRRRDVGGFLEPVIGEHRHAERRRDLRQPPADTPEADDEERAPVKLVRVEAVAVVPVTGAHFLPEYAEFISLSRIKDWLKLLDLETTMLYVPIHILLADGELCARLVQRGRLAAVLPRIVHDGELPRIKKGLEVLRAAGVRDALVGNLGLIAPVREAGMRVHGDFGLNIFNSASMNVMRSLEMASATVSFEMTLPQIRDMSKAVNAELIAYGRLPLMVTEHCLIHNKTNECTCHLKATRLIDKTGAEFPVIRDGDSCRSVLLNGKKLSWLDRQDDLAKLGLWATRLYFTTENSKEVDRVLNDYMNPEPLDPGACTRGLYLRGVE